MVIKGHKAESSLLPRGAFLHDVNAFNLSILLKMLPNVVLLSVLLDTADKDLLHRQMGTWFIGVLKQECIDEHGPNNNTAAESAFRCGICLPLWTQPSWVQQLGRPLYGALLSWPHRLPPQRSMLQSQTPLIACCWGPSSPRNNKMIHIGSEKWTLAIFICKCLLLLSKTIFPPSK